MLSNLYENKVWRQILIEQNLLLFPLVALFIKNVYEYVIKINPSYLIISFGAKIHLVLLYVDISFFIFNKIFRKFI